MDEKRLWFSNLLLLGFDTIGNERKFRISFNESMFDLPNMKGLEVVLHFIFHKLNPEKTDADFRDCWPVYDKKDGQSFRRVCSQWFAAISKDDPRSGLPRQAASLLLFPEGKKLHNLLLNFTHYCLKVLLLQTYKKLGNKVYVHSAITNGSDNVDQALFEVYDHFVAVGIINHTNRVVGRLHTMNNVSHPQWRQYAQELMQEYRRILALKNDKIKLLSQLKTKHECLNLTNPFRESEREAIKSKVDKLWKEVDAFVESTKEEREVLKSVLKPSHDCHVIDGKDLQYKVSQNMGEKNEENLLPVAKCVNLSALVSVSNECLSLLQNQLNQGVRSPGLATVEEELEFVQQELSHHTEHLQSAQFTRLSLKKLQEDLRKRIAELQESPRNYQQPGVNNDGILKLPSSLNPDVSISLGSPSFAAPPIILDTTDVNSTPLRRAPIPQHYAVTTPVAISKISKDVLNKHRTRTHSDTVMSPSLAQRRHTPYNKRSKTIPKSRIPMHTGGSTQHNHISLNIPVIPFGVDNSTPSISLSTPTIAYTSTTTSTIDTTPSLPANIGHTCNVTESPLANTIRLPLIPPASTEGTLVTNTIGLIPTSTEGTPLTIYSSSVAAPLTPLTSTVSQMASLSAVHYTNTASTTATPTVTTASQSLNTVHVDTTIDKIADKIAELVCSEDTPLKHINTDGESLLLNDYEAFTTQEKLLRTPNNNNNKAAPTANYIDIPSTGIVKGPSSPPATPNGEDGSSRSSSSSSDFNLLSNEVPPTPYREIDLTPDGVLTNSRAAADIPPLILLEDSDD